VKYAWMSSQTADHSIRALCRALGVSASGYYAWRDRKPSARELEYRRLARVILQVHLELREACGAEIAREEIAREGHPHITRAMAAEDLCGECFRQIAAS
jgi:putative transposase